MDKTSLMLGWLIGRQIAGQRTKQKTITGYSYNGTVLPALPEWDSSAYPYAVIDLNFYDGEPTAWNLARIYFSPVPLVRKENVDLLVSTNGNAEVMIYKWTQETGTWENDGTQQIGKTVDMGAIGGGVTGFIWTNTDLYNEDGTLYLPASDPIPVYE